MPLKLANNASGTLATAVTASDVGVVLTAGDGAKFPVLSSGDYFYATLFSSNDTTEIVKVTARAGDTMTILRAQEGTSSESFAAGSLFELRVTAQSVLDAGQSGGGSPSGDAATVEYNPGGLGSVLTTVQEKLRESVSVFDFGALGDGVADDTAAIQAAVDAVTAAGGGILFFPAGQYLITTHILIAAPNVLLVGEGAGATIIRQTTATADGLSFIYPVPFSLPSGGNPPSGGGVLFLTVEAGDGFFSNEFSGTGSSGVGIYVRNAYDNFQVDNVSVHNFATGCALYFCSHTRWRSLRVLFCATAALFLDSTEDGFGGANSFESVKLSNNGFADSSVGSCGIIIRESYGEWVRGAEVKAFDRGVVVDPDLEPVLGNPKQVFFLVFDSVFVDGSLSHAWEFDGTVGFIYNVQCSNSAGNYSLDGHGLYVHGANVDLVSWRGGLLRENAWHGIYLEDDVVNTDIANTAIVSNGTGGTNVYSGVSVAADVDQFSISNCRIGNLSFFGEQKYGVEIAAGTSANFIISGNDLSSNITAPLALGTSSNLYVVANNLPLQSPGLNVSNTMTFSGGSGTTIAAGSTRYLGSGDHAEFSGDRPIVIGKLGVVLTIYAAASAAPGVGQTFTYALMKNGVATSMTFTISGASATSGQSSSNSVAVAPTDYIELRVITSAGAAVAKHRFFMSLG